MKNMGEVKIKTKDEVLTEETLQSLEAIGEVLLRIRKRMISEGFDVVDGKVIKRV